jgi:hypothetical protein
VSNNTIDPRILTRYDGAQDLSMVVEKEDEPDADPQISVDNDDQQFLATPFDFSFEQLLCKCLRPAH